MKVLSPVKSYENAKIVIQSGADEVYLGSPTFSARSEVNLSIDEIENIVNYARNYSVKVYVAFNVVVFDSEVHEFLSQIIELYNLGIDGIIIQDISFIKHIKSMCPDLEIHCSTQMNVNNQYGAKYANILGANRIVVPREMGFEDIKKIKHNANVEIEAFIHGALCASYSGLCYDSVLQNQNSANRGRCSQYCRREMKLFCEGIEIDSGYLLNLKDLNNYELIEKYTLANIDSIKIEGRLKRHDYAGLTTDTYKNGSNNFNLDQVYNRTFTSGLINGEKELVNKKRCNNTGEEIGIVESVTPLKNSYYSTKIKLSEKVNKGDNIRFLFAGYEDGQVVEKVEGAVIYSKLNPPLDSKVFRTSNKDILDYYQNIGKKFSRRKIIDVDIFIDQSKAYIIIGEDSFQMDLLTEIPVRKITSVQEVNDVLAKTNDTPFIIKANVQMDEYFIPVSQIKKLKNAIIEFFNSTIILKRDSKLVFPTNSLTCENNPSTYVSVTTLEQYEALEGYDCKIIVDSLDFLDKVNKKNDYLMIPSVVLPSEWDQIDKVTSEFDKLCVSELGALFRYKDSHDLISNYTFNTTNINMENFLNQNNVKKSICSIELNKEKINSLDSNYTVVPVYGHIPVMTMEYCPINEKKTCDKCTLCINKNYYIQENGKNFQMRRNQLNKMVMYSHLPISLHEHLDSIKSENKFISFTIENEKQVKDVMNTFKGDLKSYRFNLGSFFKEVL